MLQEIIIMYDNHNHATHKSYDHANVMLTSNKFQAQKQLSQQHNGRQGCPTTPIYCELYIEDCFEFIA